MATAAQMFSALTERLRGIDQRLDLASTPFLLLLAIVLLVPAFALTFRSRANQRRLRVITSVLIAIAIVTAIVKANVMGLLKGQKTAIKMAAGGIITVVALCVAVVVAGLLVNFVVPLSGAIAGGFASHRLLNKLFPPTAASSSESSLLRDLVVHLATLSIAYFCFVLGWHFGRAVFIAVWTAVGAFLNMLLVEIGLRIFAGEGFLDHIIRLQSLAEARSSDVFTWVVMAWAGWLVLGLLVQWLLVPSDEGEEKTEDDYDV